MDRDAWIKLNVDALDRWYRSTGAANPRAELIERDGALAVIIPDTPERSIFNAVVYTDPGALAGARDEFADAYAKHGCAWTVWAPADDTTTAELLEAAGHKLDANPEMMGIELAGFPEPDLSAIEWSTEISFEDYCVLGDRSYGLDPGSWVTGIGAFPPGAHPYVASFEGEPSAIVLSFDHPGPNGPDCSVWAVGTLPEARGKGLSTALMRRAIWDAAQRGCVTSSLQATKLGAPVYRRVGYEGFGPINMWEFREAS